jgi:LAO/AO transport system kinase
VRSRDPEELVVRAVAGDRGALARLLTAVERGGPTARAVARLVHPMAGHAYTIGVTGAPGSGKSTLTDALISHLRTGSCEVAVLAVDPTSPYTGGAILGDRVRMQSHDGDDGVFVRSMASRGHLGGLALATPEAIRALDAAGFPVVVVETVGVGQVEVEIAGWADTTVVVVNPGWGDAVQANKAGLLEVADVFVVNKADRDGAAATGRDLEQMLDLSGGAAGAWRPPVVTTVASTGTGVADLWDAVTAHRSHLEATGGLVERRRARAAAELRAVLVRRLELRVEGLAGGADFRAAVAAVVEGRTDPWSAVDRLLSDTDLDPAPPIGSVPPSGGLTSEQ